METLLSYYGEFMELSKTNPIVASVVATGVGGTLIMSARNLPSKVVGMFRTLFFRSITLEYPNDNLVINHFLDYLSTNGLLFSRNSIPGRMGNEFYKPKLAPSYGRHYWFYGKTIWFLDLIERDSTGVEQQKFSFRLSCLTTRKSKLLELCNKISKRITGGPRTNYTIFSGNGDYQYVPNRKVESVILNEGVWEHILGTIDTFLNSEEWYISKGFSYKLNIILVGPPGTGKSSIISAIATHYGADIYNRTETLKIEPSTSCVQQNGRLVDMYVIEDIEQNRLFKEERSQYRDKEETSVQELLNRLSGTGSPHGLFTIITSNDLSKLPEQLLRPSRIDLIVEVGYLKPEAIGRYMNYMFEGEFVVPETYPDHRASYLQETFLKCKDNPEKFLEIISQEEPKQDRKSYLEETKSTTPT